MKPLVLVVDDKANFLKLIVKILGTSARVVTARGVQEAIAALEREPPNAVVCDLRMPDGDGLEVLRALRTHSKHVPFILTTAYATVPTAVQAMREGAYDYLTKPFDPDELRALVERALAESAVLTPSDSSATPLASAALTNAVDPAHDGHRESFGSLLGSSPPMQDLYRLIERVAPTDATVLITGETGAGKELVAREIHARSTRRHARFVALNCAALPRALLESELFGYARGTFTGATTDRAGLFEEASGGTLFLDEIGELRPSLQAKLTRALEERAVRRIGESRERKVDVRLIAATHRDVPGMVRAGSFREDLWYRLNVCIVHVPALRDRTSDIPQIARHFLSTRAPDGPRSFAPATLAALRTHRWPGNVRELRSVVERASILANGTTIDVSALPPEVVGGETAPFRGRTPSDLAAKTYREVADLARDEATKAYLEAVLDRFQGNVTAAAQHAGIERESFHRLMRRHGLQARRVRSDGTNTREAEHDGAENDESENEEETE